MEARWSTEFCSDSSHGGPGVSLNPPSGYFPSPTMCDWNRYTQRLAEYPHWFLELWHEGNYDVKSQVEASATVSLGM